MVDDNEAKLKKKLLVFVHGLGANGNEWWGLTKPSIENSPKLSEFDKLFFDYETSGGPSSIVKKIGASIGALDRSETVPQAAERLWSDILHMMQVNQYSDVYLLGHSMGGIVIASAIDHAFRSKDDRHPVLIDAIKKIALVASPISGAKLASKAAWLYRFLGPNEHINILRHESIVREDLVSEFVDHLLIGRKVPMHIFRAGNDSAVGQNELTEEIPEGIKFRFDVLKGGHSECIQDLKPWDRNFEKLLMWINPYKVDFDQVSPDEKPEIDQTGQIGIPALGPGERYLINEAPNGWTTQFQSMQEYMQGAFGIKGDLGVVDSAAGKEALVIRSIKASSIIPTPFVSQINGRPFPTALEIPLSAEFVQETKDVTFNGVPNQNVTIILQLFAVEGNFQDYTITIKSFEHQGDPGQEKELADMQTLFNSFTLLGTLDKDKTAMDAPKEADEKQEQFIVSSWEG
jgi:pimeloyl-ACP methyl ester carboxylesterase